MVVRWIVILLFCCTSCQSGLIPCPTVKAEKMKKSHAKRSVFAPKLVTASAAETKQHPETVRRTRPMVRPALEHVDVEEWDCPKPGQKKTPKAAAKKPARKQG